MMTLCCAMMTNADCVVQTMNDALTARQTNITRLNDNHKALMSESDRCNLSVPSELQREVDTLNADWESVQLLASQLSHMPLDISMEDMAAKQGSVFSVPFNLTTFGFFVCSNNSLIFTKIMGLFGLQFLLY